MLLKDIKIVFWLLALIAISIFACRKDISSVFNPNLPTEIQWAKDYYADQLELNSGPINRSNPRMVISGIPEQTFASNKKRVNWTQAAAGFSEHYTYVEASLLYDHKLTPTVAITGDPNTKPHADQTVMAATIDRLVIYKDKRGKINQRIITYIPDADYLKRHKGSIEHNRIDKLDKDFFGYLHYKAWDGSLLFVLRIENGLPVKRYAKFANGTTGSLSGTVAQKPALKGKVMVVDPGPGGGGDPTNCYFVTWDWYQDCYYASPESTVPYYCDPAVVYNVQYVQIPCPSNGEGGGGGGGPSDPVDPPECLGVLVFETGECITEKDCAGVDNGLAYMVECGCIGGTTGIDSCSKNPCDELKIVNSKLEQPQLIVENTQLAATSYSNEYGTENRLTSIPGNNYKPSNIRTTGANNFSPVFSWNSTDGYTIGFNHKHTNLLGPSPGDIMTPFEFSGRPSLVHSGQQQYYKDNMYVRTTTGTETYITTIRDWSAVQTIHDNNTIGNLNSKYESFMQDYLGYHPNASFASMSEYALIKIFGNSINFFKLNNATGKFEVWTTDGFGNLGKVTCP